MQTVYAALLKTLEVKMVMYSIILDWVNGSFRGIDKVVESNVSSKKPSGQVKIFGAHEY